MILKKQIVERGETPMWKSRITIPKVTASWHHYMIDLVVEDFKQSVLQISEQPVHDKMSLDPIHYEFPNGYNQVMKNFIIIFKKCTII